jgi:general stress protein YciG
MSDDTITIKRKVGFAALDPEKLREIARKGGKAAHEQGVAYEFDSDAARSSGLRP